MQRLINDGALAVRIRPDQGPAVLWIHGYTMSGEIWEPLWDRLTGGTHIAVDLPGHGASEPFAPDLTLPALGEQIAALCAKYGVSRIVGVSFGGMVALQAAAVLGSALQGLLVVSPALGGGPQDAIVQTRNLELYRMYRERGAGPWLRELWMAAPSLVFAGAREHPLLWKHLCEVIDRHSWQELSDARMHRLVGYDQLPDLKEIRAATTVVIGTEDMAAFKRSAELVRRTVPGCRREYLAGGHLSVLEVPDAGAPLVTQLLELPAAAPAA